MRWRAGTMVAAAAVALSCLAPACSPGLGDLKAASHDGGNPDSGGSGGTAGVGGTAGSAGADASTAGSGGSAGSDAGSDAGDAGTFTCTPKGGVFDVLSTTDLGGTPIASSSLLVVDGAASGFGNPNAYVVVATGSSSSTTTSIVVRTIVDAAIPQGSIITFDTSQPAQIVSGYASSSGLHVLGWRGVDLVDWTFPVGLSGNLLPATANTLATGVCSSSIAGACFMGEGATLHRVVTCNDQTGGNGTYALSVDGQTIASGPATNLIVHDCLAVGTTYVIRTGDPTSPQLHYGQTMSQLAATHPFALTLGLAQNSVLGPLAATPSNDGMVLLAYQLAAAPQYVPLDVYAGTLPIGSVADLGKVPVPELSKQLTVNQLDAFYGLSRPDVGQKLVQYAGFPLTGSKVILTAVGTGGDLLGYGVPVYTPPVGQSTVAQAAVGVMGPTSLVAWDERQSQPNTDRVRGQMMLCSVQ